jgi:AcrR family transcriptional regulator
MPPGQELSELRKEQILEAAMVVFARLGFHKARMDDIVQEAGLSKGAVYWYFKSKDEIITTILNRFMERELEDFRQIGQIDGPIPIRLTIMMKTMAKEIEEISDLMPIIYEFYAVAAREETIRKTIDRYLKRYTKLLEQLIKTGIERGELRNVPPRDAAVSLIALIEGCMLIWILGTFDHREPDLEKLFVSTMNLLLDGLKLEG